MATFEKLEKNRVKLTIEISVDDFGEAMQNAYLKTRGKYNIPGFRKGKAPRKMIENMYGEGVFYEDAFELIYNDAYLDAVEEHNVEPVDRPDISIERIGGDEPLVFVAEVDVKPEVQLGQYKGIEVVKRAYEVEESEIDGILAQERQKVGRLVEQERPVETGDRVILDYSGSVDGVKFDGGTAEDQPLEIGSGSFIPGFEEQLVGLNKGEERAITVTFPAEYHAAELAGKEAVFEVKIKAIQVEELPELNDDFAQDISEFETLEELRADKRAQLVKRNEDRAKAEMENEAAFTVAANATFDVPNAVIERQMDYMLQDIAYRLSMSGLSLEQYCQYMGMEPRALRETYRKEAEERVRVQLTIEAIGVAEEIVVSAEELDAEIASYAAQAGQDLEAFKKTLQPDDEDYFRDRLRADKTIKLILDNAVLVDAPPEEKAEEKPKKAPAKKAAEKKEGEKKPAAKKAPAKKAAEAAEAEKPAVKKAPAKKPAAKKAEAKDETAEKKAPAKKPAAKKAPATEKPE